MGEIHTPSPVLPITAVFSRYPEALQWVRERAEEVWGPIVLESPAFPFQQTAYYDVSMGPELKKIFFAFKPEPDPSRLVQMKHDSNAWEKEYAMMCHDIFPEPRPVNIDPGYIELGKLILASSKDFAHRIYLNRGIYAEITLFYRHGRWQDHPWTFPDYRAGHYHPFFNQCREFLKNAREK